MKYIKIIFISTFGFFLTLLLIFLAVEKKTEQALKDYSMLPDGVKVVDKAILGRRERTLSKGLRRAYLNEFGDGILRAFRRGAISLVCTNQNNVLLIVQDYKPTRHGKAGGLGKGLFDGSDNTVSKYGYGEAEISNMTYLSRGYFDVYVSDPLSRREINSILEILKIEGLSQIGIVAFDGGAAFARDFELSKVEQLINSCQP
ncbi:MAG: hypothetical protein AAGE84_05435 [Cyanobacteria bacterium P01_G01_bin.39]